MSEFKGVNGHWRTQSLFVETNRHEDKYPSLYTIKDEDNKGYQSLRRLYLETMDPTEYGFADKYLGGWDHWEHLCAQAFFKDLVGQWRNVLAKRIQHHLALEAQKIVNDPNSSQSAKLRAMKFIAQAEYEPQESAKGRPSKERVAGELKRHTEAAKSFKEDYERLGIKH